MKRLISDFNQYIPKLLVSRTNLVLSRNYHVYVDKIYMNRSNIPSETVNEHLQST